MNKRPLYENLDTSFVNLSALVKYLRHREFVGSIRVELNNYEADIVLYEQNKIGVREHDRISGRISEGEEAFQRLLIRAREAGGTIHVYHLVRETKKAEQISEIKKIEEIKKAVEAQKVIEIPKPETPLPIQTPKVTNGNSAPKPSIPDAVKIAAATAVQNGNSKIVNSPQMPNKAELLAGHLKLPFELGNKFDKKNRQLTDQDWQTLLGLTGELLVIIDKSLAEAKLDFKSAFSKACSEISADYPFLNPKSKIFTYQDGKVSMSEQVSAKLFVMSIIEALRKILEKLGANPKFAEVYRTTVQKILALINHRQTYYDKFSITPQLKKILGV